jgi:hypothetical protein
MGKRVCGQRLLGHRLRVARHARTRGRAGPSWRGGGGDDADDAAEGQARRGRAPACDAARCCGCGCCMGGGGTGAVAGGRRGRGRGPGRGLVGVHLEPQLPGVGLGGGAAGQGRVTCAAPCHGWHGLAGWLAGWRVSCGAGSRRGQRPRESTRGAGRVASASHRPSWPSQLAPSQLGLTASPFTARLGPSYPPGRWGCGRPAPGACGARRGSRASASRAQARRPRRRPPRCRRRAPRLESVETRSRGDCQGRDSGG